MISTQGDWVGLGVDGNISVNGNWHYTLKQLTLGKAVTDMECIVDEGGDNLATITCKGTTPPKGNSSTSNEFYMNTKVYVPASALETYKANDFWGKFWNIEPIK